MTAPHARSTRSVHRLDYLDGYRAIAALGVVVFHLTQPSPGIATGVIALDPTAWRDRLGNFAVCLFFLISGLVLYRPFVAAHLHGDVIPRTRSFLRRRVLRIFPAYVVALTAFYWLGLLPQMRPNMTAWEYVWQYLLLQNYVHRGFAASLPVAWTLSAEMAFYLALPLLALGIRRLPGGRSPDPTDRLRAQVVGLVMIYLTGWGYRAFLLVGQPQWPGSPPNWLPGFLDWFALGMLLAVLHVWRAQGGQLPRWVTGMSDRPWLCWVFALELYWLLVQVRVPGSFMEDGPRTLARFALSGIAALALLAPAVLGQRRTVGLRTLDSAPLRFFGGISYGVYLWHLLVIRWIDRSDLELTFWPHAALVVAITTALSLASYRLVERPVMQWRRSSIAPQRASPRPALITQ